MTERRYEISRFSFARTSLLLGAIAAPGLVLAHPADLSVGGFAAGLGHPWMGLDHLIAMVLVGVWAMQLGGRARWALPLAFVSSMVVGSLSAQYFGAMSSVDLFTAGSVLMLGALVAMRTRVAAWSAGLLVAVFAVFHGHAHGLEMPAAAVRTAFTAGFALSTLALHIGGLAAAYGLARRSQGGWVRAMGASAAVAGAVLMMG